MAYRFRSQARCTPLWKQNPADVVASSIINSLEHTRGRDWARRDPICRLSRRHPAADQAVCIMWWVWATPVTSIMEQTLSDAVV